MYDYNEAEKKKSSVQIWTKWMSMFFEGIMAVVAFPSGWWEILGLCTLNEFGWVQV